MFILRNILIIFHQQTSIKNANIKIHISDKPEIKTSDGIKKEKVKDIENKKTVDPDKIEIFVDYGENQADILTVGILQQESSRSLKISNSLNL